MRIPRNAIPANLLTLLLQDGVDCPASTPATVQGLLTEQLGIALGYVRERIATIFLDGLVVDLPELAVVRDGSVLTLSAAMPGLVGATLRKGSYYARMRSEISWASPDAGPARDAPGGTVRVRLFNLVLREQGAPILTRGVMVGRPRLLSLLGAERCAALDLPVGAHVLLRVVDDPGSEFECV